MDDIDQEFWDLIQTDLQPTTAGDGDGWVVSEVLPGIYDVTCAPDMVAQMEATKFLALKLRLDLRKMTTTPAYPLDDGRVAVCFMKRA